MICILIFLKKYNSFFYYIWILSICYWRIVMCKYDKILMIKHEDCVCAIRALWTQLSCDLFKKKGTRTFRRDRFEIHTQGTASKKRNIRAFSHIRRKLPLYVDGAEPNAFQFFQHSNGSKFPLTTIPLLKKNCELFRTIEIFRSESKWANEKLAKILSAFRWHYKMIRHGLLGTSRSTVVRSYTYLKETLRKNVHLSQGIKNKSKKPRIGIIGCTDNKNVVPKIRHLTIWRKKTKCRYFMCFW